MTIVDEPKAKPVQIRTLDLMSVFFAGDFVSMKTPMSNTKSTA